MEKALTDLEAASLYGQTDSKTGVKLPDVNLDNWGGDRNRADFALMRVADLANELRVYAREEAEDSVGIRAGRRQLGSVALAYAGADPALTGLTNNATTKVWFYSNSGTGAISSGASWPAYPHWPLAEVTMLADVLTAIEDHRGRGLVGKVLETYTTGARPAAGTAGREIFNTTTSKPNYDTGAGWVLADGTSA